MSKFVPFNGKGLCRYNHVDKGYVCSFCTKSFNSFDLYEDHWPKCTGVCVERPFKPFGQPEYPKFPSSFAAPKPAAAAPPKETKPADGSAKPKPNKDNSNNSKKDKNMSVSGKPQAAGHRAGFCGTADLISSDLAAATDDNTLPIAKRTFQVEAILNDATIKGVHRFEVKWEGFDREHNLWFTEEEFQVHGDALDRYKEERKESTADVSKFYQLLADAEGPPISVVNKADSVGCPENFTYINNNIYSDEIPRPCTPMFWCECTGGCRRDCECAKTTNYDARGLLRATVSERIVECGPLCKCADSCTNRVVQRGSKVQFELERYEHKGWGVVTEVSEEGHDPTTVTYTYMYDLDKVFITRDVADFCIDAKTHGNTARFFNHSCNPNMKNFAVYIKHRDPRLHRLAMFTTRDARAGDELILDYSPEIDAETGLKQSKCYCGLCKCRGFLSY
ncbi:hypothetical protein GGI20_003036 [Coemansia sp. BCRC 34301]|nr:hypothetical protein GGI20_003036 [Coemansia sp. BCRC 34301]